MKDTGRCYGGSLAADEGARAVANDHEAAICHFNGDIDGGSDKIMREKSFNIQARQQFFGAVAPVLHHIPADILAYTLIVGVGEFFAGKIILEGSIDKMVKVIVAHVYILSVILLTVLIV